VALVTNTRQASPGRRGVGCMSPHHTVPNSRNSPHMLRSWPGRTAADASRKAMTPGISPDVVAMPVAMRRCLRDEEWILDAVSRPLFESRAASAPGGERCWCRWRGRVVEVRPKGAMKQTRLPLMLTNSGGAWFGQRTTPS